MTVSRPVLALWAKSGDPPHSLVGHMLDTAAVALTVLTREPGRTRALYARDLGLDEDDALRFIAAVVGAHDLGKATPVFQSQWEQGRRMAEAVGFRFPHANLPRKLQKEIWVPHAALTESLIQSLLQQRRLNPRLARDIARCLGGHHGHLASPTELSLAQRPETTGSGRWDEAREGLLDALFTTVGVDRVPDVDRLPEATAVGIMALASFADWIASDGSLFPYCRDASDSHDYWRQALQLAEQALDAIGWRPRRPLVDRPLQFEAVFPFRANRLQETVANVVQQATRQAAEPLLLVVEAPMGTGKTEAALYAHLVLQRALDHRGLYVALPTMATGNGMFPRVAEWLQQLGRTDAPVDLQLQHGTAFLQPTYRALRPRSVGDGSPRQDGRTDCPEPPGNVVAEAWFGPLKRAMLSEYGVGTVDQALLGVLRVRHHFVRLWGLGNRTVVLDEVHAYDAYTSGLIAALLRWLRALGSSVILMSATLPRARRRELVEAYGAKLPDPESPYPRLTVVRGQQAESIPVDAGPTKTFIVNPVPRPVEQLAPVVLALVSAGGCAACILNTVDRAQRLYLALGPGELIRQNGHIVGKRVGPVEVYLLHARFPAEDREAREQVLRGLFGKDGYRDGLRPKQAIVVATQVIEQSLDLDFDVMVTDLAPVDLVLQRAGRLHRFDLAALSASFDVPLERPESYAEARLLVAGLDENPPDVAAEYWDRVYSPYVLLMSWWVLRKYREVRLPFDVEALIEEVYEGDVPEQLPSHLKNAFKAALRDFDKEMDQQKSWAHHTAIADPARILADVATDALAPLRLDDEEDEQSQRPLTRLGEPSVPVVLLHRVGDRLYHDPEGKQPVPLDGKLTDEQAERLYLRSVRLGRPAVYRALIQEQPPAAWQNHPLLRTMRVLTLVDGEARIGGVRIRLDYELGVVYEW